MKTLQNSCPRCGSTADAITPCCDTFHDPPASRAMIAERAIKQLTQRLDRSADAYRQLDLQRIIQHIEEWSAQLHAMEAERTELLARLDHAEAALAREHLTPL